MASAPKERGEKRGAPGRAAPEREGGRLYDVLAIAGNRRAARAEREREREPRVVQGRPAQTEAGLKTEWRETWG